MSSSWGKWVQMLTKVSVLPPLRVRKEMKLGKTQKSKWIQCCPWWIWWNLHGIRKWSFQYFWKDCRAADVCMVDGGGGWCKWTISRNKAEEAKGARNVPISRRKGTRRWKQPPVVEWDIQLFWFAWLWAWSQRGYCLVQVYSCPAGSHTRQEEYLRNVIEWHAVKM